MPPLTARQVVWCVLSGLVLMALLLLAGSAVVNGLIALGLPWPTEAAA